MSASMVGVLPQSLSTIKNYTIRAEDVIQWYSICLVHRTELPALAQRQGMKEEQDGVGNKEKINFYQFKEPPAALPGQIPRLELFPPSV